MNTLYARFADAYGVTGPLLRAGKPCQDLKAAKMAAKRTLARGAVEVEVRTLTNGKEIYAGTVTATQTLFVEDYVC